MTTSITKQPDLPVVVRRFEADFNMGKDAGRVADEDVATLDAQTEQVYFFIDVQNLKFAVEDMLHGVNMITRQKNLLKHPRIIEAVFISNQRPIEMMVKGLASPVFGRLAVKAMPSLEVALDYVRQQIKQK
jgi:hypothetical protein